MKGYFVIVSATDKPMFERPVGSLASEQKDETRHLQQFVAHSALDAVDQMMWKNKDM